MVNDNDRIWDVKTDIIKEAVEKMTKVLHHHLLTSELKSYFSHLNSKRIRIYSKKIRKHSWFLDYSDIACVKLLNDSNHSLELNDYDTIDKKFISFYESTFREFINKLITNNPERKIFFEECQINYNNGLYASSIVLMLTQIDGICSDIFGMKFFIKDKKCFLPQINSSLNDSILRNVEFILEPLLSDFPIICSEQNINNYPVRLNRHEILHGVDTKFNTKINCLKIFSLLIYVNSISGLFKVYKL